MFEVFPNPVAGSGAITIKVHKPGAARIETRDEQGRAIGKIFEGTIDAIPFVNDVTMDVGKGVYFITLELNGKTYRKKIVR